MKFQRRYKLTIDMKEDGGQIIIEPPFTIQFNIERSILASLNTMQLTIYNLSELTRGRISQDRFINPNYYPVKLEAGYDDMATVFSGNLMRANSMRQGSNIVTLIDAMDGGFDTVNTMSFKTIQKDTTVGELLKILIGDFPNLNQGVLSPNTQKFQRPVVINGNTLEQIKKYSDGQYFIDSEKVNVLAGDEVLVGDIPLINDSTGLLETPQRDGAFLSATTLFEPRIIIGQAIELQSTVMPLYNGQYKVVGASHQGIISEAVNGQCQSRFNLLLGQAYFGAFKTVT